MRDKKYFSVNLYNFIKKAEISNERFAFLIGVSPRTVYDYLSGKKYPSIETLIVIADFFDVSLDKLFYYHDKNILTNPYIKNKKFYKTWVV